MTKKIAALTGITGQVGAQLARKLLNEDYKVFRYDPKKLLFQYASGSRTSMETQTRSSYTEISHPIPAASDTFVHQSKPDYFFNLGGHWLTSRPVLSWQ